ncbi:MULTISPECIES: flavin-containing monooxygenase [Mycobacteriaceae]|jgi:cation diffusion facilitator CzcD-associated flavoprotein CzcO|uniref:FAD dependent oxidoreductase n=10 Tax=Mycobacteriaceae TaxID=1762 RepID=D5PE12_9MYCO|nr:MULTISPECIES: NAD(P)/FAD-dependent oxidoreductase [Mycobacteriaceae]PJE18619.1 MAG: 4-hydroxyacetophenone monooxygenase [Mycobacterium sp.]APT09686.1 4-hydroxyacetophenone monooxygenase [Mycobacterium avium subsp. hominissuis]EFG75701.1 FAD dependent oxidoreductase [Mycobacterium parascrofulaceum ATCC BAA-614]ETZ44620.1 pyridine nucleotide-disulfide oxidoreductase family protein [Mycobacterium avium MAV_120809_2495]ETZ54991.1 pyridine nucleotide-disulfide oxidoreductase family protein [Myco
MSDTTSVLIIGAGFAGLGTAIQLLKRGIDDFVILERAGEVGGTWRDNSYPGAACDIPSLLYSYSFEPNPDWSRAYSGSSEILAYIKAMVDKHALARFICFHVNVTGLAFDEDSGTWTVETDGGSSYRSRTVVMASGPLANANFPDIRGLHSYAGHKIHSARWDHDYDMSDKRVAVIGTGASAVQIVPELVKTARSVKVFQRTPGWVLPRPDFPHPSVAKAAFGRLPILQSAARQAWFWAHEVMAVGMVWNTPATTAIAWAAKANLRRQVKDSWMRRQLTPDFRPGCKRMLMTSDYYPALRQNNCKLITWPIATISPIGIRTADGIEHEVDCIVFATGFDVCKAGTPFPITGVDGRKLAEEWSNGAYAYKSVSVSGYPNLFFTFGPNSGPGHNSALVYLEAEIRYIVDAIGIIIEGGIQTFDVKEDRQNSYHAQLQRRLAGTTWNSGCKSWYLTEDGYNGTMYPGFTTQFARQLARVELDDYSMSSQPPPRKKPRRARPELAAESSHGASKGGRQRNDDRVSVDKREGVRFSAQTASPEAASPRMVDRA